LLETNNPNKWIVIVYLSHQADSSINAGIPKELCSLKYITIDHIKQMGQGTMLAKIDVKSAFWLLPVHPADCHLLAMKWKKQLYTDTCLPFGIRSAPKLLYLGRLVVMDSQAPVCDTSHALFR